MNARTNPASGFRAYFNEHDVEGLIDLWVFRPVAELLSIALAKTSIRPNQVSFGSVLAGIASACCYYQFTYAFIVAGGLFLGLSVVFDAADGQLARRTGQGSEIGKLFDNVMDPIKTAIAMFGMAFGMEAAGTWGEWPAMPEWLTTDQAIWGLGWFAAVSLSIQVMGRNFWVDRYDNYGKGRTSLTLANMDKVRAEMETLKQKKGLWLEQCLVPIVLAFSSKKPKPELDATPHPEYVERLRPLIRWWTMFDGAQQFFVLILASCFGLPVVGWLYIALVSNAIMLVLTPMTMLAHRKGVALGR
jgi:phosphatidylglycerophosphate synthase